MANRNLRPQVKKWWTRTNAITSYFDDMIIRSRPKWHVFWNQRTLRKHLEIVRNDERREIHVKNSESAGKMWILIFPLTLSPSTIINTGAAAHCRVVLPSLFYSALSVQQYTAMRNLFTTFLQTQEQNGKKKMQVFIFQNFISTSHEKINNPIYTIINKQL